MAFVLSPLVASLGGLALIGIAAAIAASRAASARSAVALLAEPGDLVLVRNATTLNDPSLGDSFALRITGAETNAVSGTPEDGRLTLQARALHANMVVPRSEILGMAPDSLRNVAPVVPPGTPAGPPPGPLTPPVPSGPKALGNPINVRTGGSYAGVVALSGIEAAMASPSMVESQFAALGFTNVRVSEAPPPGFPDHQTPPGRGIFFVLGSWGGGDSSLARPSQLAEAWET